MNIVLVEDDHTQAEWIKAVLTSTFAGAESQLVKTESDFMTFLDTMSQPPDLFIVDALERLSASKLTGFFDWESDS